MALKNILIWNWLQWITNYEFLVWSFFFNSCKIWSTFWCTPIGANIFLPEDKNSLTSISNGRMTCLEGPWYMDQYRISYQKVVVHLQQTLDRQASKNTKIPLVYIFVCYTNVTQQLVVGSFHFSSVCFGLGTSGLWYFWLGTNNKRLIF